jgi:predicted glycosyltransferase
LKVLIDIGHPAHVHLFKHFAHKMIGKGHQVHFTLRDRVFVTELLAHEKFDMICFGSNYHSAIGKFWGLLFFTFKLWRVALKCKPDIYLSHGSMYAAVTAFLMHKPHISFEDTFNKEQVLLYKPFSKVILTGNYKHPLKSKKMISYAGYHELAYLHPKRFTPDISVLEELGVKVDEKYVILRFVSLNASHDIGHKGISLDNKFQAVKSFSKFAKVFISSEAELPDSLTNYKIRIAPHRMHDALAFASLIFGESATMVSEGVALGIPGIYLDNTGRLYTKDQQEKYGLCYCYTESDLDQKRAIDKGLELLQMTGIKEEWKKRRDRMLEDKIDVTAFLLWFIENYPESKRIMKENPDYQYRFR